MTDHLATGMKRMIRTVARSASLFDRLGEQSRLLRLTGNRSTLDFRPRRARRILMGPRNVDNPRRTIRQHGNP